MSRDRWCRMVAVFVLSLGITQAPSATIVADASTLRVIDDTCGTTTYNDYFFPDGPAYYWYTGGGGFNSCYMWTYTLDGNSGNPPVNLAWWYTDPNTDPNGYSANASAYQAGYTTCPSVFYNVKPNGNDLPPNNSYWVSQAGPQWASVFTGLALQPYLGAKTYLGDQQFCSAHSSMNVDGFQYYWPAP
jgi:hypothetical protein